MITYSKFWLDKMRLLWLLKGGIYFRPLKAPSGCRGYAVAAVYLDKWHGGAGMGEVLTSTDFHVKKEP